MSGAVEEALRARREAGGKSLVIYMTGALDDDFETTVLAVAAAGADVMARTEEGYTPLQTLSKSVSPFLTR